MSGFVRILGLTHDGRTFRPSDWAERLAGAMSSIRPPGLRGLASHIGYSPYCVPRTVDGVKCVFVAHALKAAEPMAWDFVMNFARDNDLQTVDDALPPPAATPVPNPDPDPHPVPPPTSAAPTGQ